VQPSLSGNRQAAFLGDSDEIAQMSEFHINNHTFQAWLYTYKVFFFGASRA
jgi:hypothetical protein